MTLPTPQLTDIEFRFGGHNSHGVSAKADIEYHGFDLFAKVNDGPESTAWLARDQEQGEVRFPAPLKAGDVVEVTAQTVKLGGKDQQELVEVSERSAPQRFVYSGDTRLTGGKLKAVD